MWSLEAICLGDDVSEFLEDLVESDDCFLPALGRTHP